MTHVMQAQRDFGYKPVVGFDEAVQLTLDAYPHLHNKDKRA